MKKKSTTHRYLALAIAFLPFMASCSNMSDSATIATTTIGTSVLSGGAAYGLTKAFGGSNKTAAWVAAGTAAVSAYLGYRWGKSIVKQRSDYQSAQEYIRDNQKQMDTRISQAKKRNTAVSQKVASVKQSKQSISKEEKQKTNAELASSLSLIDQDLNNAKAARAEAGGADKAKLDAQIQTLSAEKKQLEQNKKDFASLYSI